MSDIGRAVSFASLLYRQRAATLFAGYVRRDPMARLQLRPGRVDPYAIYERMRAVGPLVPTRLGNWASTSHRICNLVLRDRRFGVRPPVGLSGVVNERSNTSFLTMNPPDHTRLRRLATPAFSPKAVNTYRDRIERTVGDLLDRSAAAGEFDLVSSFAAALPIAVITDLLGIPDADTKAFARYGTVIGSALDGIRSMRHAADLAVSDAKLRSMFADLAVSDAKLRSMFAALFELRRRDPGDDIVSHVVAAEGDQIKPAEMMPLCVLLLVAGFETTVNLIGNGVLALLDHPQQWEALRADPAGMAPKAVAEVLRYDPPVQRTGRTALETMEIDGVVVHKGQLVATLIGGANRDPEVYDRPNVFDISREPGVDHLAFSSGIHYCIGQPLASLEATIAFQVLAERMPKLRRIGPVRRRNATAIRGPIHIPVSAT